MLVDPFYRTKYKEIIQKLQVKEEKEVHYAEYSTIHNKYPLISENIVYQRFKHKTTASQFNNIEKSSYSGQIYVIKSNQNKKRKLKQHKLGE